MVTKHKLSKFLKEFPLYKPFKAVENYTRTCEGFTQPIYFIGETFTYHCDLENEEKTFEIDIPEYSKHYWGRHSEGSIPKELFDDNEKLNFIHPFIGNCKSCKKFNVTFLLHVWSDIKIPVEEGEIWYSDAPGAEFKRKEEFEEKSNIYIEKIGLNPERKVDIDKSVSKHFDRETQNWYFKALKSLNENMGIASFAYFRRIIEKELITIVKEIAELDSGNTNLKVLYDEYVRTSQVYSIYENIFEHLPKSLQSLGINPIKTLYQQTSEGLHSLSEEECLRRAESIDLLLKFVIKKINEESSEILKVKEAIKNLR